jgi:hippurate hydrolase
VPSVLWFVGGTDPEVCAKAKGAGTINEIPSNHDPRFAPVIHPTLRTGVETHAHGCRATSRRHSPAARRLTPGNGYRE